MKLKMISMVMILGMIMGSSATAGGCDTDELCDIAGELRSFHIPYIRGAADNVNCPGSYDEGARAFLEAAVAPVKRAQTLLCASTPDLSEAQDEVKTARDLLRSTYTYFRRAITIDGCTDPDAAAARDRAYDAWAELNYMYIVLKYDCD